MAEGEAKGVLRAVLEIALVVGLMESLQMDLVAPAHSAAEELGVALHSFDAAVEHALGEWEQAEPLAAR